jgi:putative salt-induced outer membrane protein YdiY
MDRKAENFFEMYTASRFRLGVIYREGEVVGRFIEVTADMGFVYNDRLYYKDEMVVAWYNYWVDEKKLHRKAENSYNTKTEFYHVDKGRYKKLITLTLPKTLDTYAIYPYLDTLSYGVGKVLYNSDNGKMRFEFTDQYGKCKRLRCQLDVITQKYIDNNEAVEIKFGANAGNYTTVDNLIYSVKNGGHCLK